jgi:hypothetical protein
MWCRHASYEVRHGVNTRKQQILAEVSGDTCEVVLRRVISSKESRLLTWQPNCQRTCSHKETRELRAVQPRPRSTRFNRTRNYAARAPRVKRC